MGWVVLALLVVAALCALGFLLVRHRAPVTSGLAAPPPAVRPAPAAPADVDRQRPTEAEVSYRVLVGMVLGDRARADRLIAFEAERAPQASRSQCINNAVERLRRDLGR